MRWCLFELFDEYFHPYTPFLENAEATKKLRTLRPAGEKGSFATKKVKLTGISFKTSRFVWKGFTTTLIVDVKL